MQVKQSIERVILILFSEGLVEIFANSKILSVFCNCMIKAKGKYFNSEQNSGSYLNATVSSSVTLAKSIYFHEPQMLH